MDSVIGRDAELVTVTDFLDCVAVGPAALVLGGPAGIGKTTLGAAVRDLASARSWNVISCQPAESEARLAYVCLDDLLRGVLPDVGPRLHPTDRRAIEAIVLGGPSDGPVPDERALGAALVATLSALSREQPLLIFIDNANWIDEPSTRLLSFASRRLGEARVGFALCSRSPAPVADPLGLRHAVAAERMFRLDVGPLTAGSLHHVVKQRVGAGLPRPALLRIHDASGGNPLLAIELARGLAQHGAFDPGAPLPLSGELSEAIARRVAALPESTLHVLAIAASAPRPTVETVLDVAGGVSWDTAGGTVAEDADIVVVDRGRIRFTHPLLASAASAAASAVQRREIHRKLAERAKDIEQRARHVGAATTVPDENAASVLDSGAAVAWTRGAPIAASELADLAIELTPADDEAQLAQRYVTASAYLIEAGNFARADQRLDQFMESGTRGPGLAMALRCLARLRGENNSLQPRALLTEALAEAPAGSPLAVTIQHDLAWTFAATGEREEMRRHAEAALAGAEACGDPSLVSAAAAVLLVAEFGVGQGLRTDLLALIETGRDVKGAEPLGPLPDAAIAGMLLLSDDLDGARRHFVAELTRAVDRGSEHDQALVSHQLADVEWRAGRPDLALALAEEALRIATVLGHHLLTGLALAARARARACLGQIDGARVDAEQGMQIGFDVHNAFCIGANIVVLGFLEWSVGDAAAAHARLGMLGQLQRATSVEIPGVMAWIPDEVEALLALDELEQAADLLAWYDEVATRERSDSALARVARCKALVAAARSDLGVALDDAARAVDLHAKLPLVIERGRALIVYGQILRRTKQKRAARGALEEAWKIFDSAGMPLWRAKVDSELARIGRKTESSLDLTETERQIAELAVAGRRNREIAAELFLSERTVVTNLTRIYAKLGVKSRPELSAGMAARANIPSR